MLSFQQPVRSHSRWDRDTVNLGLKDKGFYLVEAVKGQLCAYTLVMVSDMVMISKPSAAGVVNFVVDRRTGQPIREAKVSLLARDTRLGEANSSADGIAELHYKDKGKQPTDLRLVAQHGNDFAVNLMGDMAGSEREQWTGYAYTDRPVYRPGHTVHFKALLRMRESAGYSIPAAKTVSVVVNDSDQKPVYQKSLTVSPTGSIHDELTLPVTAALGDYDIQIKSGDTFVASDEFEVQEYKKPEYEVRVIPAKGRVVQGESTQVTIDSRYFFGEPVSSAKVTYAFYRTPYYFPLWYDPDEDTAGADRAERANDADDSDNSGDQVQQTEGQLDADGKLIITLPTRVSKKKSDYAFRMEARVTDQGKREITGKGWVVATYGSFLVRVTPDRYFYTPGSNGTFTVEARDYDNKPVRTRVHVELLRWDYRDRNHIETVASRDVDTGAEGSAPVELAIPPQGGSYRVKVSAHTPEGRDIEDYEYLWVSGNGFFDSGGTEARDIQIVTDKKTYRAGDTAHLMIVTGKPNTAVLVSVEGRDLRQYKVLRSPDATVAYDVPVTADDEPGINVAAGFVRNGTATRAQVRQGPAGGAQAEREAGHRQAAVSARPDRRVQHRSHHRRWAPAPRAEFSLGVVDEAIYAIRPDTTAGHRERLLLAGMEPHLHHDFPELLVRGRSRQAPHAPGGVASAVPPGAVETRAAGSAQGAQGIPRYGLLGRRRHHRRRRPRPRQGGLPRFAHHLAGHRARRHARNQSGQRHAQDHRPQEPDRAPGGAALLRAGRRGGDFGAGAQLPRQCARRRACRWMWPAWTCWRARRGISRSPAAAKPSWTGGCAPARSAAPPSPPRP